MSDEVSAAHYRIIRTAIGYTPQHKTALGWKSIKQPQPTIQQARAIIAYAGADDESTDGGT